MNIQIIDQGLGDGDSFQHFLLRLIADDSFVSCNALIAFVTSDGLLRLGPQVGGTLQSFLMAPHKSLHWIIGADAVTTAAALEMLREMQATASPRCSIQVLEDPGGRLFHPKLFIFEGADGSGAVLIGSNNLTPGGLQNNIEAAVLLSDLTSQEMVQWRQIWQRVSHDTRLRQITDELIARVRQERQRQNFRRRETPPTEEVEPEVAEGNPTVLVRYIAGAGDRTSQVHFSRYVVENYFELSPGDGKTIDIQLIQPGELPGPIENRPLVFSQVNANPKIEMDGVKYRLPDNYPTDWYAILVVQQVETGRYKYMVLIPTDAGYDEINNHLSQVPRRRALQEDILLLQSLLQIWPDYPV